MKQKDALKKVAIFLGIMHPIEALIAARMARKRGKKPLRWFLATLVFGVFAMNRLKALPPVSKGKKSKKDKSGKKSK
jgi:uncharacterized protein YhhL (DUF1145 family)